MTLYFWSYLYLRLRSSNSSECFKLSDCLKNQSHLTIKKIATIATVIWTRMGIPYFAVIVLKMILRYEWPTISLYTESRIKDADKIVTNTFNDAILNLLIFCLNLVFLIYFLFLQSSIMNYGTILEFLENTIT